MQLSKNFWLNEFTFSETAVRHGIVISVEEDSDVFKNLQHLAQTILQPLRNHLLTPIVITSGYRPSELNKLIGGSSTSQHMKGEASDFVMPGYSPYAICKIIEKLNLPYDQLIHEFGRWVHVSAVRNGEPRKQALTAYYDRGKGKTVYILGIHKIP